MIETNAIDYFLTIAKMATPSGGEDELIAYIETKARTLGLKLTAEAKESGCLVVHQEGSYGDHPHLFFLSHLDTSTFLGHFNGVRNTEGVIRAEDGGYLGADDKAGVAAMLAAMEYLVKAEVAHGPIDWIFTTEEEAGLIGSKRFPAEKIAAEFGYCLDAPGDVGGYQSYSDSLFIWTIDMDLPETQSRAALTKRFLQILKAYPGKITWQVEQFFGKAAASFTLQVRIETPEAVTGLSTYLNQAVTMLQQEILGAVKSELEIIYPGFALENGHPAIQLLRKSTNIPLYEMKLSGGTDANIWNTKGKPTLLLAAGFANMHTAEENISIHNLQTLAALVCSLCTKAVD